MHVWSLWGGLTLSMIILLTGMPGPSWAWQVPPPGQHPRLVFSQADLPALRAKLKEARGRRLFELVRRTADVSVLSPNSRYNLIKQALAEEKQQAAATGGQVKIVHNGPYGGALGLAENAALVYAVTGDETYGQAGRDALVTFMPYADGSGLRGASLVYDWVFPLLSEDEKAMVRTNLVRMIEEVMQGVYSDGFSLGPAPPREEVPQAIYWGMLQSGYAGIGELAIEGEPGFSQKWLDDCKFCTMDSLNRFLDEEGYHENGPSYVDYGFSNSNFWLEALRLRGTDWSKHPRLSKLPEWLTYLMLPGALGVAPQLLPVGNSNFGNLTGQDGICWLHHAMPRNPWMSLVYKFNMSPAFVNSYPRTVGALFLWDRPLPASLPDPETLPRTRWYPDGGLFFRTGWGFQDCAFWLKTQQHRCLTGQHEDYGSFYLHAYGEPFAVEGMGKVVSTSAHNLVSIDGKTMDRSSYIMPRAPLLGKIEGQFASAGLVDQKEAYSDDWATEGPDLRLVSKPLNPVERAQRLGAVIWGGQHVGPYFLVVDDLDKDFGRHDYQWRMITNPQHQAEVRGEHVTLSRAKASTEAWYPPLMDCQLLSPGGQLVHETETQGEKTTGRLVASVQATNPHFTVILYPRRPGQPTVEGMPELNAALVPGEGGHGAVLTWPECVDRLVVSYGRPVEIAGLRTDARLAVVRTALPPYGATQAYGKILGVLMVEGSRLYVDGEEVLKPGGSRRWIVK